MESKKYKAQIGATGESVWSENAMTYETVEEVKQWLDGLSMRWFGYWCSRIVPEDTPNRETIDKNDPTIYQWFK